MFLEVMILLKSWYLLWLSFMGFPRLSFRGFPLVFLLIFVRLHISWITWKRQTITQVEHIYTVYLIFSRVTNFAKIGKMWFFLFVSGKRLICDFKSFLLQTIPDIISAYWIFCYLKVMTGYKRKLDHHENYWIFGITYMHHLDHSFSSA